MDNDSTATPSDFATWTKRVGMNLRALRDSKGMSAQDIADRTAVLGHAVGRGTIAHLESGRKASVGVDEVAVLAAALNVAPLRLLYDVEGDDVEVLPGRTTSQTKAADWFAGLASLADEPENHRDSEEKLWQLSGPLYFIRKHEAAEGRFVDLLLKHQMASPTSDSDVWSDALRATAKNLDTTRSLCYASEVKPPDLAPWLDVALAHWKADA